MSRQIDWQERKAAEGNCTICGKPKDILGTTLRCRPCADRHCQLVKLKRRKAGGGTWKLGTRGRRPVGYWCDAIGNL